MWSAHPKLLYFTAHMYLLNPFYSCIDIMLIDYAIKNLLRPYSQNGLMNNMDMQEFKVKYRIIEFIGYNQIKTKRLVFQKLDLTCIVVTCAE